ncbi:MAG: 3-deoxy-D-manno-octulosonic acid transferase, partial [Fidelibacterota bacterium]
SLCWVPHEPSAKAVQEAEHVFQNAGLSTKILRSKKRTNLTNGTQVGIVATVGVLYRLYWQGQVAYIGGGFSTGVHNVMEPAIARLPVLFGPKYRNFPEAIDLAKSGGGFPVQSSEDFYQILSHLLSDKNAFLKASFSATDVIHRNLGSSTRIVRSILRD